MRKAAILPKLMLFKQLSTELCVHFKVGVEGLPTLVQAVLEVASEGQSQGMRRATADEKTAKRKKSNRKGKRSKGSAADATRLCDRIVTILRAGETVHINDVIERLEAKGLMPKSKDKRAYISLTLSTNKSLFANDPKKGRGYYVLRKGKNANLPVFRKASKKPSVIITAAETGASADLQKVMDALIAAPKSYEHRFNIVPMAKLAGVTTDAARASLIALRGHGAIAKLGSSTWRLRDRAILLASKSATTASKKPKSALNGSAAHAPS